MNPAAFPSSMEGLFLIGLTLTPSFAILIHSLIQKGYNTMRRTIKKHPFAFLHCLCWLVLAFCMGYVMHYGDYDYYDVPLADAVVVMAMVSAGLMALSAVTGIIVKLIRRPDFATRRERSRMRAFAIQFERNLPGYGWRYLLVLLIFVLPLLAFFSVLWMDTYMPAMLLASMGIAIWLCFECYEWAENRLLKVPDNPDRFHLQQGASPSLLDDLYEREGTFGIPVRLWESRRVYLYNALMRQQVIDDRSTITGHVFPVSAIEKHFGIEQTDTSAEDVVWIPMKQFSGGTGNRNAAIRQLFSYQYSALVDRQYENPRDTDPCCYPYSSEELRLVPDETAVLKHTHDQLYLFASSATNAEEDTCYHGCMLRIKGAALVDVKWDFFENASDPEDDREHYLNPEEAQTLYRLLLQDAFTYEICSVEYLEDKQLLALEIWCEPENPAGMPLKGEAASFALDDGLGYLLLLSYDQLRWHWMKETPMGPHYLFY